MCSKPSLRRSTRTSSSSSNTKNSAMKPTSNKKTGDSNPIIKHCKSKPTIASPPTISKSVDVLSGVDENSNPPTSRTHALTPTHPHSPQSPSNPTPNSNTPSTMSQQDLRQKKFYTFFTTQLLVKNIEIFKVNFSKTALLITGSESYFRRHTPMPT